MSNSYAGNSIKFETWKIRISLTPCTISSCIATLRMNITNTKLLYVYLSLSYLSSTPLNFFFIYILNVCCKFLSKRTGYFSSAATFWTQKFPLEKSKIVRLIVASGTVFKNKTIKKSMFIRIIFSIFFFTLSENSADLSFQPKHILKTLTKQKRKLNKTALMIIIT